MSYFDEDSDNVNVKVDDNGLKLFETLLILLMMTMLVHVSVLMTTLMSVRVVLRMMVMSRELRRSRDNNKPNRDR